MFNLSVVVIVKNEEKNIARCLESVKWADEIIVVDDYSADKTAEICKKYTQNVYQNKFVNYSLQKKFAFSKATKEWIISLDADEVITDILKKEILEVLSRPSDFNGYFIPRKTFFLGKWIRHCGWFPDYQLRLFKNGFWLMEDAYVHEAVQINGKTGYLKESFLHYSYNTIFEYVSRMDKYTSLEVQKMLKNGVKIDIHKIKSIVLKKALRTFWKMYLKQRGFLDGMHGFFVCIFSSVYQMLIYMKLWELMTRNRDLNKESGIK